MYVSIRFTAMNLNLICSQDLTACEIFSGAGWVARSYRELGARAPESQTCMRIIYTIGLDFLAWARSTYDVMNNEVEQDLLAVTGFFKLLLLVLCLREGGLYYGGHPCSSMVWIGRCVNCRSPLQPWGDENCASLSSYICSHGSCICTCVYMSNIIIGYHRAEV